MVQPQALYYKPALQHFWSALVPKPRRNICGLFHGAVGSSNPGPTDVTSHEFNTKYGWNSSSYQFNQSCHGGIYIAPGSPVEQYNLQVMFYYPGGVVPCFMMSDERFPPFSQPEIQTMMTFRMRVTLIAITTVSVTWLKVERLLLRLRPT